MSHHDETVVDRTGPDDATFHHTDAGTEPREWTSGLEALLELVLVGGHDHLLVLAAHPDDETLGAGGLIADAATRGAQVTVVVATLGEASHPHSPTITPSGLAARREAEVSAAVTLLAPSARLVLLRLPDGDLQSDVDALTAAVSACLEDEPTVIAAPWRGDRHPDHEACARVASELADRYSARLLEFPIWGWHWGTPGHTGPLRFGRWARAATSQAAVEAKRSALDLHRSQHTALSDLPGDEAVLTPRMLAHFDRPFEVFAFHEPAAMPSAYFERLYRASDDPWTMQGSFYEQRKRAVLLASLPRARFSRAFEPGCGTGLLTRDLADRCGEIVAVDASSTATRLARRRLDGVPGVSVDVGVIPNDWPDGLFDLVVISELGYYFAEPREIADAVRRSLTPDGVLVACHWRHEAPGYPSTARGVHEALGAGLHPLVSHEEDDFLLSVWSIQHESVARTTGVLD